MKRFLLQSLWKIVIALVLCGGMWGTSRWLAATPSVNALLNVVIVALFYLLMLLLIGWLLYCTSS